VIHASTWQQFDPGQVIVLEGEVDSSFFIIVSGQVVVRKDEQLVGQLGAGMCFGEMGFISREERTATVVALTDLWVMKVSASLIERASVNCQLRFHKVFLSTLVARLRLTTEELSEARRESERRLLRHTG
jgi:CRP-like cAMP-binding protein